MASSELFKLSATLKGHEDDVVTSLTIPYSQLTNCWAGPSGFISQSRPCCILFSRLFSETMEA